MCNRLSIIGIGKNKPINNNQSVTSITNLIPCFCSNECNLILSCITQKRFEKNKIRELLIRPTYNKKVMATFNVTGYVQVYKPISYICKFG